MAIKVDISLSNLAPISSINQSIQTNSLKIGIFANNGSGKTFISRAFRLLESNSPTALMPEGVAPTDYLIKIGENETKFAFKIIDEGGATKEDVNLHINKGTVPTIPATNYIFHTFNRDFVEENIAKLSYDKEDNIEGFILGKSNIDISEDEKNLNLLVEKKEESTNLINKVITDAVTTQLSKLPNLGRVSEYQQINFENIKVGQEFTLDNPLSYKQAYDNYEKIKNIPDNLADIPFVNPIVVPLELIDGIDTTLKTPFELSHFEEEFKQRIVSKQDFIETGLKLITDKSCPFCEQPFSDVAVGLITQYTAFIKDSEASTIKKLNAFILKLQAIIKEIEGKIADTNKASVLFVRYKSDYFSSMGNFSLSQLNVSDAISTLNAIVGVIKDKIADITKSWHIDDYLIIRDNVSVINAVIDNNNKLIKQINDKQKSISAENLSMRKLICKVVYNTLVATCRSHFIALNKTTSDIDATKQIIKEKQAENQNKRKPLVAKTIKDVLVAFFRDKYTFDDETFRLVLNRTTLNKNQAKDVLSEGEKNVIAFAYYLGDVHQKITTAKDYERLFFVIDDPISSMDFNFVYTVSSIVRTLKDFFPDMGDKERFIILTHNMEFMRILCANQIITKKLILKKDSLDEFNTNFTVPYISHLIDINNISVGTQLPSHTTANSIRFILETIVSFENCTANKTSIKKFIEDKFRHDRTTFTLINDLSHGAYRSSQMPITEDDYVEICKDIVSVIDVEYPAQIEFCRNI